MPIGRQLLTVRCTNLRVCQKVSESQVLEATPISVLCTCLRHERSTIYRLSQPYSFRALHCSIMESTGFSPPQQTSPENVTSSGTFDTPEPPAKTSRSDEGAVTTAGRVPVACAVPKPPVITIHRDNRTRTRDERSQAAVSVSDRSAHSGSMLDIQADLIRAREIARKRRERLEAEEEELEIERQIAACSSQRRSSAGSVRSAKSSDPGSPARGTAGLTHEAVFQHDLGEGQALLSAMSQALSGPKSCGCCANCRSASKGDSCSPSHAHN